MPAGAAAAPRRGRRRRPCASSACVAASYRPEPSTRPPAVSAVRRSTSTRPPSLDAASVTAIGSPAVPPPSASTTRASRATRPRGASRGPSMRSVPVAGPSPSIPARASAGARSSASISPRRSHSPASARTGTEPASVAWPEAGADRQRREREPARRVARLRLEGVGAAVDGEVLAPQRGARAPGSTRGPPARPRATSVPVYDSGSRAFDPRSASSAFTEARGSVALHEPRTRALGAERRVRREPCAVRLDRHALEREGAPRDPHAPGAGEREARRGRRRGRAG